MAGGAYISLCQLVIIGSGNGKSYPKPMLTKYQLNPLEYTIVKCNQNVNIFIQKNQFESAVGKMSVI